jgi:hypothetical protein
LPRRNVLIFVADGLRHGSVNEQDTPALWAIRPEPACIFVGEIASAEFDYRFELSASPLFAFDDGTSNDIVRDAACGLTYLAVVSALAGALTIRRFSTTT